MDTKRHSMDKNEIDIAEQTEYAISALNDSRIQHSEAFKVWMEDEANCKLFLELMNYREAMMNLRGKDCPKTDDAWAHFSSLVSDTPRNHQHTSLRKTIIGFSAVAAVLIVVVCLFFVFSPEKTDKPTYALVYPALKKLQEVTLQTSNGAKFVVTDAQSTSKIAQIGVKVLCRNGELNYKAASSAQKSAVHLLSTPRGKDFKIVLEDGTEVWLNAESSLRYPVKFVGDTREVELEGEAFFHVAKDAKHPFIVKSGNTQARVLGTQFNFRNYPNEVRHITLVSGCVKVTDAKASNSLFLKPGEDVELGDVHLSSKQVSVEEYTAWTKGLFYFEKTELSAIMKVLGRWYNLTIKFVDKPSMHYHFSFWSSRADSPQEAIDRLNRMGKVKASLNDNNQTIIIQTSSN